MTGGVCLATRVRYRQSCGLDTWSALLAYLFVSQICVAGLCFLFFALVLFFPLPSDQIGGGFLVCYFFLSFSSFICVFGCSDGMEREACVCDHGFERSDLCAEIIIIIVIIVIVMQVCMVITYSRGWTNRVRLPILLVVS